MRAVTIRVERGEPDDVELAALLAALAAVRVPARVLHPRRAWGDPATVLALAPRPGATPWRAAA